MVRVEGIGISLDGFSAGPRQDMNNPLGVNGPELMQWFFPTDVFRRMNDMGPGETGVDNEFASRGMSGMGAWILGRNMFGPVRGPWPDEEWKGWWGGDPPYHVEAFVLTHHRRESIVMKGGTVFHFVTDGIHAALERAKAAAGDRDVRIGGGVSTIRQYLQERLVDRLHLAVRPVLLGAGESLFRDLDLRALGYACTGAVPGERATHVTIERTAR